MKKILIIIATIALGLFGTKYLIGETFLNYKTPDIKKIENIEKEEKKKIKEKNNSLNIEEWKKKNKEKIVQEAKEKKLKEIQEKKVNIKNIEIKQEDIEKESKKIKNKILSRRDKYALKGLIKEGDTYLENKQLVLALRSYKKALNQTPGNTKIIKKIGDTYFEMKNFATANNYYKDLIGTPENNQTKTVLNYIYSIDFTKNININTVFSEIDKFKLNSDDNFFYKTSIECILDRKECLNKFEKYIKQGKGRNNIKFDYIRKGLQNYKNLQIKKEYFKHTQLLAALYQSKLYPISNILGDKILEKQPGYLPVLKMIAKGYYELGNYKKAKEYLKKYNKIDNKDLKVNYLLGIINIKLHEYILSNIYFNRALKLGYRPKANILRRLIYNFYLVEDNKKMMAEFQNLINKTNNINETDYSLAIYYSLINGKNIQANNWINTALKLYPNNDNFYGYKGWVYKEAKEYDNAERYLLRGYSINKHNPLINLNLGIVNLKKDKLLKAKIYFKNTIKEDANGDFGKLASEYLAKIKLEEEKIEKSIQEDIGEY